MNSSSRRFLSVLALLGVAACGFGLALGPFGIDWEFSELRLSRVLMALITGAALAATGSCLQALLKNALADPFIIGVSGGAALGGTAGLLLAPLVSSAASIGAMAGALFITWSINSLLLKRPSLSAEHILLLGVVFNTIASAIITCLKIILPPQQTQSLLFWLIGNIPYLSFATLAATAIPCSFLLFYLRHKAGVLDILAQGEEEAQRLGLDTHHERLRLYVAVSVIIGLIVAQTGLIGFVGLIIPNLLRRLCGPQQKILIPACIFGGGAFLVISDALARLSFVMWSTEIPTGAITTLIGSPLFAWVLLHPKSWRN